MVNVVYYLYAEKHVHWQLHCVIKVSVPVAEVVGVEEGRVEILPQKSVEDNDKDFTSEFSWETLSIKNVNVNNSKAWSSAHLHIEVWLLIIYTVQVHIQICISILATDIVILTAWFHLSIYHVIHP